jgi:type IV secretion system protein VirB6
MFTWVGSKFDAILSTYVLGVVSTLMTAIAPIALTAMTIWVALYGWAVLRNEVSETLPVFMWKVFKISLVLAFALQSGFYISNVSDTANALAMGVASTFLPSGVDPATVATPYALLDKFNDDASAQVADIMKEASMFRLDLVLAAVVFSIRLGDLSLHRTVRGDAREAVPYLRSCDWAALHPLPRLAADSPIFR